MVSTFAGVAILLGIVTIILGNSVADCTTLPDFNATAPSAFDIANNSVTLDNQQTGWAGQCVSNNTQTQAAFGLLIVVLVIIAAVIILAVVKML